MPSISIDLPPRSSAKAMQPEGVINAADSQTLRPAANRIEFVARMRKAIGDLTFREISDQTGANHETVRRYFASGKPSITFLAAFCSRYDVRADWLLTGVGPLRRTSGAEGASGGGPNGESLPAAVVIRSRRRHPRSGRRSGEFPHAG
jgi:hypothetical protein